MSNRKLPSDQEKVRSLYVSKSNFNRDQDPWLNKPDSTIWDEFRNGNRESLIHIYKIYFPILFNYGYQFVKDREFIKDEIQELFIELSKNRKRLNSNDNIKYYLYRSLRRRLSKSSKAKFIFDEIIDLENFFSVTLSIDSKIIHDEDEKRKKEELERAINLLPKRQKEAIYYHFYQNLTYQEIASIMGMSKVKSARTLIYRALKLLKNKLISFEFSLFLSFFHIH